MMAGSIAKLAATAAALFPLAFASPAAAADDGPVTGVVELFTSQGCNSCPPADVVLSELARRPDIVTLAYHVDYWNYLGWRDTLGTRENTERQRAYMQALDSRSVYTPQAIVNGRTELNGANRAGLLQALAATKLAGTAASLSVSASEGGFLIATGGSGATTARLLVISFRAPQAVAIPTGENQGRTITYWNPVTGIRRIGLWHGGQARFALPADAIAASDGAVALLQQVSGGDLPGPVLAAAILRKPAP